MTIAPQKPRLEPLDNSSKKEFMRLAEDHLTVVKLPLGFVLIVLIRAGYETDGASIPDWVSEKIFGTPWDMPRLLAAIVHDLLYSIKWKCRLFCDMIYKLILKQNRYGEAKANFEYLCLRAAGWNSWNNVNKEEKKWAKKLSEVRIRPSILFSVEKIAKLCR